MLVPTERNRLLCGTLAQSFPIYLVYRRIVGVIDRVGGRDDWEGGILWRSIQEWRIMVCGMMKRRVYPRMRRMVRFRNTGICRHGKKGEGGFEWVRICCLL